ncbi:MAG: PilZ domain-containing protein [Granulosicoccus sp.]
MTTNSLKGIISFSITDRGALHSAYMPFMQNGGMFVPSTRTYQLGDEVFVLLRLMNDASFLTVVGTVAWMTPVGAQGNKVSGIGVHFSEADNDRARLHIEHHLQSVNRDRPTHTM